MKKVDLRTAGSILSVSTVELRKAIEASGTRTTMRVGESLFNEGEAGDAVSAALFTAEADEARPPDEL